MEWRRLTSIAASRRKMGKALEVSCSLIEERVGAPSVRMLEVVGSQVNRKGKAESCERE